MTQCAGLFCYGQGWGYRRSRGGGGGKGMTNSVWDIQI